MKKTEKILIITALTGIILGLFLIPGGNIITVLSLAVLSMLYFYFSLALLNGLSIRQMFKKQSYKGISAMRITGSVLAGIVLSILTLGVLFKVMLWPGSSSMLLTGGLLMLITGIICLIKFASTKAEFYRNMTLRSFIFTALAFFLAFSSLMFLQEFKYRNYPEYLELMRASQADPDNQELWQKLDEKRQEMAE